MLVDLIQITTRDDVRLHGMLQQSTAGGEQPFSVDAVCMVHGTGGNFYSSTLFDALGERLLGQGCHVLRVNTRGHDGISTASTARGGRVLGAAYEVVDDCRHDLTGWLGWLGHQGYSRVVLVGHSLGAVKCLYTLAHELDLEVAGVVAISPPRLSYSWFCQGDKAQNFLDTFQRASHLVETGHPQTLIEVNMPLPFAITAAGYVEKYGPDERYHFLNFVPSVKWPTLVTFGSVEVANNVAFQGSPEALTQLSRRPRSLMVKIIDGGDHFYSQVRPQLADCLEHWLRNNL